MGSYSRAAVIAIVLLVAGRILQANLAVGGADPGPAAEKASAGSNATVPGASTKVATVLGRDILRKDIEPTAQWLKDRERYVKLHGEKMGYVTPDVYRRQKLQEAIWNPLSAKYISAKELEPTEEELKEFTLRLRQANARAQQGQQERQKTLQAEADRLERLLASQDERAQEGTRKRIRKMREEIVAIEKSLEIDRRKKDPLESEQLLAKWWVGHWKQQRWFYKRYGGRVIYQQVGPEAIDAMRDFLKQAEAKKDFAIYDQDLKASFWEPFIRARPGVFVPNPDKAFEHPWSIMDRSVNDEKPTAPAGKR